MSEPTNIIPLPTAATPAPAPVRIEGLRDITLETVEGYHVALKVGMQIEVPQRAADFLVHQSIAKFVS